MFIKERFDEFSVANSVNQSAGDYEKIDHFPKDKADYYRLVLMDDPIEYPRHGYDKHQCP